MKNLFLEMHGMGLNPCVPHGTYGFHMELYKNNLSTECMIYSEFNLWTALNYCRKFITLLENITQRQKYHVRE